METTLFSAAQFGLDVVLKVTFLTSLVLVLIGGLRRLSASSRHLVAMLGLAGSLVLPFIAPLTPGVKIPIVPSFLPAPADISQKQEVSPAESTREAAAPVVQDATLSSDDSNHETDSSAVVADEAVVTASGPVRSIPADGGTSTGPSPLTLVKLALLLWALGTALSMTRLAFGWWRLRRIARSAEAVRDPEWIAAARDLGRRLGLSRPVQLLTSSEVPVAMTAGVRNPVLLLHQGARKWPQERRRVVLLHELAHVRRADWITLLVAEIAAAVYWFHPLVWLARREARRSCERACDDLVLDSGTKPSVYAAHLLGIVRSLKPMRARALPVMAMARPSQFEGRMRAILDPGLHRRGPSRATTRAAALGALFAVVSLGAMQPWAEPTPCAEASPEATLAAELGASGLVPAAADHSPSAPGESSKARKLRSDAAHEEALPGDSAEAESPAEDTEPETEFATPAVTGSGTPSPSPSSGMAGFVRASNGRSRSGRGWYSRGMDLHHDERYDQAIEAFEKAIELGYKEGASAYNIACGFALKGDRDRAFEWLGKAREAGFGLDGYLASDDDLDSLRSDPRYAQLKREVRAKHAAENKDHAAAAARRYERLAAKSVKDGSAYFESGRELLKAGEYALAARAFEQSADAGNRVGTSLYNEACALSLAGQTAPAMEKLRKAIENGFDGASHMQKDEDLDAIQSDPRFQELVTLAEDLKMPSVGWYNAFLHSPRRAEWREAVKHAEKVAARYPKLGRAWFNLGFAQIRAELPDAAAGSFQKALDLGYRKSSSMYNLACSFAMQDRKDQAFDWLFKALDAGFDSDGMLRGDDDLDNLRGDPRFRKAIEIAKKSKGYDDED